MSKSPCLLVLVFLGSIALVPMGSWANAIQPDQPSICDAVAGNLVMNCGFETSDFSHWTVTMAESNSNLFISPISHSGSFAAAFEAFGTTDDSISQVLSTTAGRDLHLSFFLSTDGGIPGSGDFSASWDGTRVFSAPTTAFGYTQFSFVVPGQGSDTLQFAGRNPFSTFFLDDIVVTPVATPEPGTLSLFGLGLLFGGALLWRKTKLLSGVHARRSL